MAIIRLLKSIFALLGTLLAAGSIASLTVRYGNIALDDATAWMLEFYRSLMVDVIRRWIFDTWTIPFFNIQLNQTTMDIISLWVLSITATYNGHLTDPRIINSSKTGERRPYQPNWVHPVDRLYRRWQILKLMLPWLILGPLMLIPYYKRMIPIFIRTTLQRHEKRRLFEETNDGIYMENDWTDRQYWLTFMTLAQPVLSLIFDALFFTANHLLLNGI